MMTGASILAAMTEAGEEASVHARGVHEHHSLRTGTEVPNAPGNPAGGRSAIRILRKERREPRHLQTGPHRDAATAPAPSPVPPNAARTKVLFRERDGLTATALRSPARCKDTSEEP